MSDSTNEQDQASIASDAPPPDDGSISMADAMRLSGATRSAIHNCVPIHKGRVLKSELMAWVTASKETSKAKNMQKARERPGLDEDWHRVYLDVGPAGTPKPTASNARIVKWDSQA